MNCDELTKKVSISDTLSGHINVVVDNLKKIVDLDAGVRNSLIASYSSDHTNKIAYSTSFCKSFNAIIDILNKEDKDRRIDSNLDSAAREQANKRYSSNLERLTNLLLRGMEIESKKKEAPKLDNSTVTKKNINLKSEKNNKPKASVTISGKIMNQKKADKVNIYLGADNIGASNANGDFTVSVNAYQSESINLKFESTICGSEFKSIFINNNTISNIPITLPCK